MLKLYKSLLDLLDARERRRFVLLLVLIIVMGLFDMVGVAVILPFLAVVSDPGQIESNGMLRRLHDLVDPASTEQFLILLGVLVFAVMVLGLVVRLSTMYAIARFTHMRNYHISSRLLEGYLRQPYDWFLNQDSARLSKTILTETARAVGSVMIPAMRILAQTVSLLFLTGLLLYVEPGVALSAAAMIGVFYGLVFVFVRKGLNRMGHELVQANTARFRAVEEAMHGIKEIKILGLERLYAAKYRGPSLRQSRAQFLIQVIGELPRYVLETVAFGGIVLLVLVFLLRDGSGLQDVLPILGIFAMAGLRMLTAIQQIYHSMSTMRSGQAVLDLIHDDVMFFRTGGALPPEGDGPGLRLTDRLVLEDVGYAYPSAERTALDGVNMVIRANTTVGIVGGTGAGKTTVVDLILGLLTPARGRIVIDGTALSHDRLRAWQNSLGYVPQQIYLTNDSVAANIAFGIPADKIDMAAVERAARLAELHEFVTGQLEHGYAQMVGDRGVRLSGGQRQRIGIARALYHDPDVLIFDEATSALDNITEEAVMKAVANLGHAKTIIMIAHRLTTVENCDEIFLLEHGRVADSGPYAELVARNETFRKMARVG